MWKSDIQLICFKIKWLQMQLKVTLFKYVGTSWNNHSYQYIKNLKHLLYRFHIRVLFRSLSQLLKYGFVSNTSVILVNSFTCISSYFEYLVYFFFWERVLANNEVSYKMWKILLFPKTSCETANYGTIWLLRMCREQMLHLQYIHAYVKRPIIRLLCLLYN